MSEVVADDTPAVQAVLKADTRRLKLLEEEKRLQARLEKGEDSVAERLDKVSVSNVCNRAVIKPNTFYLQQQYFSVFGGLQPTVKDTDLKLVLCTVSNADH